MDIIVKIPSNLLDKLIAYRIAGEQMQCLLLILRKTYGFNKKEDRISLSQFVENTGISKRNVHRALAALIDKKIVVKKDNNTGTSYSINTTFKNWKALSKKTTSKIVVKNDNKALSKMTHTISTSIYPSTRATSVALYSASAEAQKRKSDLIRKNKTDLIPKKKSLTLTKKNKRIFDYYYQEHYKKQPSLNTQSAKNAKYFLDKLARGNLFNRDTSLKKYHGRKFSEKEIKFAIDRHITKALDDSYQPRNKGYLFAYLPEFFYNKFSKIKSLFLDSFENPPVPVVPILVDRNPELSKALFDIYNKEARNGISMYSFDNLAFADKNCFTVGAFKLNKFVKLNGKKINRTMVNTNDRKAKLLWSAILMCANKDLKKVSPFWFKADFVFERLPIYMKDRGYLTAEIKKSLI